MFRQCLIAATALVTCTHTAIADSTSVGPNGIDAIGLRRPDGVTLTGSGVNIGQVETKRVAKRPFDSDANSNAFVIPFETRTLNGSSPNVDVESHGVEIASIMIGAAGAPTSVSPGASLYSSGFNLDISENELLATQYIAKRYSFSDTRRILAVNQSWGDDPLPNSMNDGNSLLTLGMDWIASEFDVLNIFAGNQDEDLRIRPSDNYNGITVAMSEKVDGVYQVVNVRNDSGNFFDAEGDRVSVDLLAPGVGITVATIGASNPTVTRTGTSLAVPHVTGTVALLNEYADYQVDNSIVRWDRDNTRSHEVMKAVLLNSADKIVDVHGSKRTVTDEDGLTWEQSVAFDEDTISLDEQMGAGHLNARRALRQFSSGEYDGGIIPSIGWDYGDTAGFPTDRVYSIGQFGGGFVAVTLAWDRGVTKFGGLDESYGPTDFFMGQTFVDDLDVFVVPVGWVDPIGDAVAKSITTDDTVEHIFKDIPAGEYEILVRQYSGGDRDYGLAWWLGTDAGTPIPGDFDGDGNVDGDDLTDWRGSFGPSGWADADGDGDSDGADFLTWQQNLGMPLASPTAAAVPEPAALMLCALGLPLLFRRRG